MVRKKKITRKKEKGKAGKAEVKEKVEPKGIIEVTVKGPLNVAGSLLKSVGNIFGAKTKLKTKEK